MSNENSLVIHLLDKEYRVACPAGEQDNLLSAARYLDEAEKIAHAEEFEDVLTEIERIRNRNHAE